MAPKELKITSLYFPDNKPSLRGLGDCVVGADGTLFFKKWRGGGKRKYCYNCNLKAQQQTTYM
jgi:hypothetical protein